VVVIGAGITGLSAAYELAKRQVPFVVLEASDRTGGLVFTERLDGFTIEAGADSMLAQKPAAVRLCEELGLGPRLIPTTPPRRAYVLAGGRLHALPSPSILGIPTTWSGIASYDLLSWTARARLAMEPLVRRKRGGEDESVASFFRRRFGRETVQSIAEPLLGGIHAGDVEALSIRSLFPRLADGESRRGSIVLAFRKTRPSEEGLFRSLSSGMGELIGAIERRLPEGCVRLQSPAVALHRDGEVWRVENNDSTLRASSVVLAIPAHEASRLVTNVDANLADLCKQTPYVSTASVALAWRREDVQHALAGSGYVVARIGESPRVNACSWISSKWDGRAPSGWALFRAFVGGAKDSSVVDLGDDELVGIAAREIAPVHGISTPPAFARVHRWINAGAQHVVGHLTRMEQIDARLAMLPGLFVAGSGFRSIGIPDCVADGRAAGAAAADRARSAMR
jgi:oxygen-dependent protoporphyrinogen oxidase